MSAKRVLIVDDEENIRLSLRLILEREGYTVEQAGSVSEFRACVVADAYLVDVRLPDGSGVQVLEEIRRTVPAPVIMISGQATIADAVQATRLGAFDFLEKPLGREEVLVTLKNALAQQRLTEENERLREITGPGRMIGSSPAWNRALEQATLAARSDARVLLIGESGTGKELLAEHIHRSSPFSGGPFVKVNCAAIPADLLESEMFGHERGAFTGASTTRRGKFEMAGGGTIFLDEVGDLPLPAQAKLLRVLQEGEFHRVGGEQPLRVSVRVLSATNRDLTRLVADGLFREDLFYRLNVMPLRVPPLRERPADIPPLALYFLEDFCRRNNLRPKRIERDVLDALSGYAWPGNARELRNIVERMAILTPGESIDSPPLDLLTASGPAPKSSLHQVRDSVERDHILRTLEEHSWNVSSAARSLGIERTNLHKRMRALGLKRHAG